MSAGGAAIGFTSKFPVVTEHMVLSFPEVHYGFFPDAASSLFADHFIERCKVRCNS